MVKGFKIPVSVLVVIHTPDLHVLLLERADHPGYWQSVTGSQHEGETLEQTAIREVREETGLDAGSGRYRLMDWKTSNVYDIFPEWRWRYAPGVTRNTEHAFGLQVPDAVPIELAPREHLAYQWVPHDLAAQKVFSWSNAALLRALPELTNQGRR